MAVTTINVGTSANDNTGDTLRNAFVKTNTNFDILSTTSKLASGDLNINGVNVGKGIGSNNFNSTAIGQDTLINVTTGGNNTALGSNTLKSNADGWYNVAIGSEAMKDAIGSSVYYNVAIGSQSLKKTTNGGNTAIGVNTLLDNLSGGGNTAIGEYAMEKNIDGLYNTALGGGALYNNQTRDYNTAIGKDALSTNTLYSNCTGLGANASFLNGNNQVQLGDSSTTTYVYNTVNSRSDLRDKTEVRDTVLGLDFINELRPVDYKWDMREDYRTEKPTLLGQDATEEEKIAHKIVMDEWLESCKVENLIHDGTHIRNRYHHGLIAQEVQDVIEASGVDFGGFQDHKVNGGGDVLSLGYSELIAPMIKAIQELTARINVLENN
jgi:hypothetical protein